MRISSHTKFGSLAATSVLLAGLMTGLIFQTPTQGHAQQAASSTLEDVLLRAHSAQQADRYREAAAAYAEATATDPRIPELWANRGLMEHFAGDSAHAIKSFEHALAAKPSLYTAVLFTGIDYVMLNEPERALPYLKRALALKPTNADCYEALGKAYMALHNPRSAASNYQQAVVHNPQGSTAWYGLGVASLALIDQDGGTLAKRYPSSSWALALYADELLLQGRPREAIDAYKQVAAASTEKERRIFAAVLLHTKNASPSSDDPVSPPISRNALLRILATNPESLKPLCEFAKAEGPNVRRQEIACSYMQNDANASAFAAAKQLASHPEDTEALYWSVKTNEARAVDALEHFERIAPESAATYDLIGDLDRRRMLPDSALEQYEKALAINPHDMPALLGSTAAYLSIGKMEKSMSTAEIALSDSPENPRLNLLMSESLINLHRYLEAKSYLEKCIAATKSANANPGVSELASRAHALLGKVRAESGDIAGAISEMELGLPTDRDGSFHFQLSRLYRQQGKLADAKVAETQAKDLLEQRRAHAVVAVRSATESLP